MLIKERLVRGFARLFGLKIHSFYDNEYRYSKWVKHYNIPEDIIDSLDYQDKRFVDAMINDTEDFSRYLENKVVDNLLKIESMIGRFGLGTYTIRKNLLESAELLSDDERAAGIRCYSLCMMWEWESHNTKVLNNLCEGLKLATDLNQKQEIWLRYISILFELNNKKQAEEELHGYINEYGIKRLHEFPLVAELSESIGIFNEKIHKSASLSRVLSKNDDLLRKYVEGKNVAVVGNSPDELGKGKGEEIDSHEVIFRFNDYKTDGYEADYGSKVTALVKNGDVQNGLYTLDIEAIEALQLIVMEMDIRHFVIPEQILDMFSYYADICPDKICRLNYRSEFIERAGVFPTSGALLIYNLQRIKKEHPFNVEYYGFSFFNNGPDEKVLTDYYRSNQDITVNNMHHNIKNEKDFIKRII